jgi:acetyl esterase/lipase
MIMIRPRIAAAFLLVASVTVASVIAPPGHADEPTIPGVTITPDVVYGHKDGMALTYDVFRPDSAGDKPGPCLLLMVSGGWVSQWMPPAAMLPFTKPFLDHGYTVCAVRHGSSPKYLIPEIVTDVRSALEHVTDHAAEHGIDRNRLGVFGFSAGGHLSLMLGTTTNAAARGRDDKPRVGAVAAVFPPTDLTPYLDPAAGYLEKFPALKFPRENGDSFSPLKQVSDDDAPALMVHGDKDELVPLWHSEKIRDALRASDVSADLVVIEGAGHGFNAAGNETMFRAMLDWFDTHLATDH